MTKKEIKPFLLKGLKIRRKAWGKGKFIHAVNGTVKDQDGATWNDSVINRPEFDPNEHSDWEVY